MTDASLFFKIAAELKIDAKQVKSTIELLDEGATVPFISRYRKEVTGSLDEVQVITIKNEIERLRQLEQRRESILKSIEGQGKLTPELSDKILAAETLSTLEDLYLPYKPRRRTKATVAREKGLEPLAQLILAQQTKELFPEALKFVNKELGVEHPDDALAGARDIIAEIMSEDAVAREGMRILFKKSAAVCPPGLNCHISPFSDVKGLSGLGGVPVGGVEVPSPEVNTQPGFPTPVPDIGPVEVPLSLVCMLPSLSVALSFSLKYASRSKVALDIGAHVGLWSVDMANHFKELICFEPIKESGECLIKNMADRNITNYRLHDCALGSEFGTVKLNTNDDNSGNPFVDNNGCLLYTSDAADE